MGKSRTTSSPSVGVPAVPGNQFPVKNPSPATFPQEGSQGGVPRIEPTHRSTPARHLPTPGHHERVVGQIGKRGNGGANDSPLKGL